LTSDDDDLKPVHSEGEILERVHKRATQLRRRKRFARASAAATIAIVVLAGGLAIAHIGGTKHQAQGFVNPGATDSPIPSDTSSEQPSPSASESPVEQPSPTDTPRVFPLIVIAPTCVNSYDSACGAFYWDPAPGPNAPMTLSVTASRTTVTVGETISVTGTASDPDAELNCHKVEWGPTYINFGLTATAMYGRWVTPDKTPGSVTETFTHVYDTPGTYQVVFEAESGSCGGGGTNPYSSQGTADVTVTVLDAPTPSPTVTDSPTPSASASVSPSPSP